MNIFQILWGGVKWIAGALVKVFQWAWKKPTLAIATGLTVAGLGYLASAFGWEELGGFATTFGWTLVSVGASSAAFGSVWSTVKDTAGSVWDWLIDLSGPMRGTLLA